MHIITTNARDAIFPEYKNISAGFADTFRFSVKKVGFVKRRTLMTFERR